MTFEYHNINFGMYHDVASTVIALHRRKMTIRQIAEHIRSPETWGLNIRESNVRWILTKAGLIQSRPALGWFSGEWTPEKQEAEIQKEKLTWLL